MTNLDSILKSRDITLPTNIRLVEAMVFPVVMYGYESWTIINKVKAQSCPTLCDPIDCSLPGSSVCGIFQATVLEWIAIFFSRGIFPTQGLNPGLPHCRQTLYCLSHQGSWVPKNLWFWTVVLEKTLESTLDCKEIKPINLKGNQSWIFNGRTDAEA